MIKYIISAADIHFKNLSGLDELGEVIDKFIEQCQEFVNEHGKDETRIILGGDLFHSKVQITNESQIAVHNFFKRLNDICITYVTAGNHDFLMNNTDRIDSLTPLFEIGSYENVKYLDKMLNFKSGTIEDDNIVIALWSSFDGFKSPDLTLVDKNKTIVGLVHAEIKGYTTNTKIASPNGLEPNVFDGCDFVIAGHIHKHQEIKGDNVRIVYCSSLKQMDKGESINMHGFVLWSMDKDGHWDYDFVEVDNCGYGYYNFVINNINDIEEDKEELVNLV